MEASNFCDFLKVLLFHRIFLLFDSSKPLFFHRIFLLFDSSKPLFFYMCINKDNYSFLLCPIMINFDAADVSECLSEEVISFFWRSVYVPYVQH